MIQRCLIVALAFMGFACLACGADAADRLRIAIQKTGTASWEIALIKERGLDKAADLDIETTELASTDAGKIREAILSLKKFPGAEGEYNFDQNGDGLHGYNIVRNEKGTIVYDKHIEFDD